MRLVSKLVGLALALVALAGFTASSAFADGTVTGSMEGETAFGSLGPCGFGMDYEGDPTAASDGNDVLLVGSSFAGQANGGNDACDTGDIISVNDIDVAVSGGGSSFTATLDEINVLVQPPIGNPCRYITDNPINATGSALLGPYAGSGAATGQSGFCGFLDADVNVTNVILDPA